MDLEEITNMATITTNTNFTVPDKVGGNDGSVVIKQYSSLTINDSVTLGVDQKCRGLFIYVQGNLVLGTSAHITMSDRGAKFDPTASSNGGPVTAGGMQYGVFKAGSSDNLAAIDWKGSLSTGNTTPPAIAAAPILASGSGFRLIEIEREHGNSGASKADTGGYAGGNVGGTGTFECGGGGSGGACFGTSGAGGQGNCFAGGFGSGGTGGTFNSDSTSAATHLSESGGSNSGGGGASSSGGILFILVGGNVTFGSSASLTSTGGAAAGGSGTSAGGGGAGGGIIYLGYRGTLTGTATMTVTGGSRGGSGHSSADVGGHGGAGYSLAEQII